MISNPQRVFLDWSEPCLPQAAKWLHQHDELFEGGQCLIVTPGARAGRRLLELLVQQAGGQMMQPPRCITPSQLQEYLSQSSLSHASATVRCLVLWQTLIQMPDTSLEMLLSQAKPETDALDDWLDIAQRLDHLFATLASGGLTPHDVLERCPQLNANFEDTDRWTTLADLYQRYMQALADISMVAPYQAPLTAIEQKDITWAGHIILVGMADMNQLTRQMLHAVADRCIALIHAPRNLENLFGPLGELNLAAWEKRPLVIEDADHKGQIIRVVSQPADQVRVILEELENLSNKAPLSTQDITLGAGDQSMAPLIEQLCACARVPTRWSQDRPMTISRPMQLLKTINAYISRKETSSLALLIRHADMGKKIDQTTLAQLDQYVRQHQQANLDLTETQLASLKSPLKETVEQIRQWTMFPGLSSQSPAQWSVRLIQLFSEIYKNKTLSLSQAADVEMVESFENLSRVFQMWQELPQALQSHSLNLSQAINLLEVEFQHQALPRAAEEEAIEILGWLELHLDEAPIVFICNFNEGLIPQSPEPDPFLPDSIRKSLGLACDASRLVRDQYMLESILHSKKHVRLIGGHVDLQGNPLMPSRLMFRDHPQTLKPLIERFYDEKPSSEQSVAILPYSSNPTTLWIPPIQLPDSPITELPVTAFKNYLTCPYRFYLKYICKLKRPDPFEHQLTSADFGSLAHRALEAFGKSDVADSTRAKPIFEFLGDWLQQYSQRMFGPKPLPAVRVQLDRLMQRFNLFADQQASFAQAGWRIQPQFVEHPFKVHFPVNAPDDLFTLVGKIDRIDQHESGVFRIIDYKTADKGASPDKTHRVGAKDNKTWIDLQLPLYRHLAQKHTSGQLVELGYFCLSKNKQTSGYQQAPWDENDLWQADQNARFIINQIRQGIFWPPAAAPVFSDGLEDICMDHSSFRQALIQKTQQALKSWEEGEVTCLNP